MTGSSLASRSARGAAAGAIASSAMGVVLLGAHRAGLVAKVAPEKITESALDALGVEMSEAGENAASSMSHVAFGATCGALYALLKGRVPVRPIPAGLIFAGGVLLASYQGWVPAVGAMPPLQRQTRADRWTVIVGHGVYGAVLGGLVWRWLPRTNH